MRAICPSTPEPDMKTLVKLPPLATALLACALAAPVFAQSGTAAAPAAKTAGSLPYEGQIRRINPDTGRVTLSHGPLTAFNMGPMTMVFAVKDPKQLAAFKEGDKVRFALEPAGENLVVTRIEAVK
jgi:Cu(I)/Ag(I) efflux system protein CusF